MQNKKYLYLIGLFLILMLVIGVTNTYSLFETNSYGNTEFDVGKWKIKLNDIDVTFTEQITLDDFTYSTTTHTEDDFFAPGRSAELILEIDASETEVAVIYDLEIDDSSIEDYPNIHFTIRDMDTGTVINGTSFTGVIPLADLSDTKTIKITLIWDNNINYDESDTTLVGQTLDFVINANFKQYLGDI